MAVSSLGHRGRLYGHYREHVSGQSALSFAAALRSVVVSSPVVIVLSRWSSPSASSLTCAVSPSEESTSLPVFLSALDSAIFPLKIADFILHGNQMKTYTASNQNQVLVNGEVLDPRLDLENKSPTGFAWGYPGSGPAQLALAILADHLGDDDIALRLYQDFKREFITTAPEEGFTLTSEQVSEWLTEQG